MTKIAFMIAACLIIAPATFAAEQTWTGAITDTMCPKSHQTNIEHKLETSGERMTDQECAVGCVGHRGQKYVFVSDGKVYRIANQQHADLAAHAGRAVKLTGEMSGTTITVSKIVASAQ